MVYVPLKLLQLAGDGTCIVVSAEGLAGSSALHHLYHVDVHVHMDSSLVSSFQHWPDKSILCRLLL